MGGGSGWGGQGGCEWRSEAFVNIQKKKNCFWGGVRLGGGVGSGYFFWGGGGQGCELRSEAFVNIKKKIFFLGGGRVGWGGVSWGGQGGCEWRSEAFVNIQKKKICFGGGGGGVRLGGCRVRVDGNGELKLL